jgi:pilus assembly protein CpaB
MLAEVAARPTASRSSVTTGGDVSRFWIPVSGRVSSPRPQPSGYNGGCTVIGVSLRQFRLVRSFA